MMGEMETGCWKWLYMHLYVGVRLFTRNYGVPKLAVNNKGN